VEVGLEDLDHPRGGLGQGPAGGPGEQGGGPRGRSILRSEPKDLISLPAEHVGWIGQMAAGCPAASQVLGEGSARNLKQKGSRPLILRGF
jgi:hypothetical protein